MSTLVRAAPLDNQPLVRPPGGLLDVARVIDVPNLMYQDNDGAFEGIACIVPRGTPYCPTAHAAKSPISPAWATVRVFAVYDAITCKPVGFDPVEGMADLSEAFDAGESHGVEAQVEVEILSTGTDVTGGGTALTMAEAISRLEHWYYNQAVGLGVVHMPVGAVGAAAQQMVLVKDGNRFTTALGTPVAVGTGYTGGQAAIPTASSALVYITGPMTILRGPMATGQGFDVTTNDATLLAERPYGAVNEGCAVGKVLASTTCC